MPCSASSRWLPTSDLLALDATRDATAGERLEVRSRRRESQLAALGLRDDGRRERMLGAALGRAGQAQQLGFAPSPPARHDGGHRRRGPSVSVPVLSKMTVSMRRAVSSASPPRMRMPASAPRPVPTMIAVGVARPMAQGQAMMSTVMALTSAYVRRGSGPTTSQTANVERGKDEHDAARTGR